MPLNKKSNNKANKNLNNKANKTKKTNSNPIAFRPAPNSNFMRKLNNMKRKNNNNKKNKKNKKNSQRNDTPPQLSSFPTAHNSYSVSLPTGPIENSFYVNNNGGIYVQEEV